MHVSSDRSSSHRSDDLQSNHSPSFVRRRCTVPPCNPSRVNPPRPILCSPRSTMRHRLARTLEYDRAFTELGGCVAQRFEQFTPALPVLVAFDAGQPMHFIQHVQCVVDLLLAHAHLVSVIGRCNMLPVRTCRPRSGCARPSFRNPYEWVIGSFSCCLELHDHGGKIVAGATCERECEQAVDQLLRALRLATRLSQFLIAESSLLIC